MISIDVGSRKRALVFCLGLLPALVFASANDAPQNIVGEVTTVIGRGAVRNLSGQEQGLSRGDRVRTGDQIETGAGGHVHIRFVDGGLLSVRPRSRLRIESYSNGNASERAAIKFRLEEGVVRSVTGEWGQANRDRFRLNTPIAAIGVKGTDFVVKVEGGNTFASVISGAIIMSPLAGPCAGSLGPCQNAQAVTLSADMQGQMLELLQKNNSGAPRLVPAEDLLARATAIDLAKTDAAPEARHGETIAATDTRDKARVGDTQLAGMIDETRITPKSLPLIWVHNALGWNVSENAISQRYDEAQLAGRTLLATNLFVSLYRDETQLKSFRPLGTQASFQLSSYSATFNQAIGYNRPVENVQISNGTLNADFARAQFSTSLAMSSPSLGQETYSASGRISDRGLLINRNDSTQSLIGGLSTDGTQAGYVFEKKLANGTVSGLTLWGR